MRRLSLAVIVVVIVITTFPGTATAMPADAACERPAGVQRLVFSASKYPNIRRHFRRAPCGAAAGRLRLILNRPGADERRERLLRDIPTRAGRDK